MNNITKKLKEILTPEDMKALEEAIQIMVVPKGQAGPTPQYYSYVEYAKVAANNLVRMSNLL